MISCRRHPAPGQIPPNWPRTEAGRQPTEIVSSWLGAAPMMEGARAWPLCSRGIRHHLIGCGEGVVHLDIDLAHRAFDLPMPQQRLDCAHVSCPTVKLRRLRLPQRMRPKKLGPSPMLAVHYETSRAYCPS